MNELSVGQLNALKPNDSQHFLRAQSELPIESPSYMPFAEINLIRRIISSNIFDNQVSKFNEA